MNKIICASICATVLFASVVYGLLAAPEAAVVVITPPIAAKGDRLDIPPPGTACSQQAWPNYDNECVRDQRRPTRRAAEVRIVSADWSPITNYLERTAK